MTKPNPIVAAPDEPRQLGTGTLQPREGTMRCDTCALHVTYDECGRTFREIADYAAATCAWPCRFIDVNGHPTKPKKPEPAEEPKSDG